MTVSAVLDPAAECRSHALMKLVSPENREQKSRTADTAFSLKVLESPELDFPNAGPPFL
jgi:hypothetical protein